MLRFLICCIVLLPCLVVAQKDTLFLAACIQDPKGHPIPDAHITIGGNFFKGTASDPSGCFQLELEKFPAKIEISHVNFESLYFLLNKQSDLEKVLVMQNKIANLPDVTVSAQAKIDIVYQEPYSITDYFFYQNYLVLLARKSNTKGYSLILLDEEEKEIEDFSLRHVRPKNLFQTCDGKLFLMTNVCVKEILIERDRIRLGKNIKYEDFNNGWANCVLANDTLAFFKRYFFQGQALQYTGVFRRKKEIETLSFPLIEDVRNIDLLIEESGIRMPRSGDVWEENVSWSLGMLRKGRYSLEGASSMFFPPLYAPLFPKDSMICIFNHLLSQVEYFSPLGQHLHKVKIDYHQQKKWKKKIYFDVHQEQAYTSYDTRRGVVICPIDMNTGRLGAAVEIPMDFIENVKVWNGYFYYLYRNMGKQERNRKLHRLRLN